MSADPNHPPAGGDQRLGQALRIYLDHRRSGTGESDSELIRRHPALQELLEPLLAQDTATFGQLRSGSTLGDYLLIECIGRGGMGEVWEAEQLSLSRRVALKLLRAHSFASAHSIERFRREALAGARLKHPCIVAVYAVGEAGGVRYIAQELIETRRTLSTLLREMRERTSIPPEYWRETAERFVRIAEALELAHDSGVIHRDLKPLNILIAADGTPKVADFGLALVEGEGALSSTGDMGGSPFYMSPEQAAAKGTTVDERSDVFSLGATLYEALTLERPFVGDTLPQVLSKILLHEPRDPREIRSLCPRELAVICMKMLEKAPAGRYSSMREVADELGRFLLHEPIRARPPGVIGRSVKWSRRHPVLAASSAIVCVSLCVVTALLFENKSARAAAEQSASEARASAIEAERSALAERESARLADAAAAEARLEARTSSRVVDFLVDAFTESTPGVARGRELSARDVLDRGVRNIRVGLTEKAEAGPRARLLRTLGMVYTRLGLRKEALDLLLEARRLAEEVFGRSDRRTLEICTELAFLYDDSGRLEQAAALSREVYDELAKLDGPDSAAALRAEGVLGSILWKTDDLDGAEKHLRHCVQGLEALREWRGSSLYALSEVLRVRGQEADSLQMARAALERFNLEWGQDHPDTLDVLEGLARHELIAGRFEAACGLLREVASSRLCVLGPRHASTIQAQAMSACLEASGKEAEGANQLRRLRAISLDALGPSDPVTANITGYLADLLLQSGQVAEAEREFVAMLYSVAEGPGAAPSGRSGALVMLGLIEWQLGRQALAASLMEEVIGQAQLGILITPSLVDSAFDQAIHMRETLGEFGAARELALDHLERMGAAHPRAARREATIERLTRKLEAR